MGPRLKGATLWVSQTGEKPLRMVTRVAAVLFAQSELNVGDSLGPFEVFESGPHGCLGPEPRCQPQRPQVLCLVPQSYRTALGSQLSTAEEEGAPEPQHPGHICGKIHLRTPVLRVAVCSGDKPSYPRPLL